MKLEDYLNGDLLNVRYTLKSDDITKGKKGVAVPYLDRQAYFDKDGEEKTGAKLKINSYGKGLKIVLYSEKSELSEFGLSFPFNFMGKKNGGGWENQYLLNSVYTSKDNVYKYCYLSNPKGRNLILFPKGKCDGWKADYSSEFSPGHFFLNLVFFASFDQAFGKDSKNKRLELYLFEVSDFEKAADVMAKVLNIPVLTYERSGGKLGEKLSVYIHGACDRILYENQEIIPKNNLAEITIPKEGLFSVVPYLKKKQGMEAICYGYSDIDELWKKTMDSVSDEELAATDENLCEHQNWQAAMLRFMLGHDKNKKYLQRIKQGLSIIMERDESKALPRRTIYYKKHKGAPAYSIFESERIQELLFGVTILTDMYRLTGAKKYALYAIRSLNQVLKYHFENGMIYTGFLNGSKEDYTTVCCLIVPFIDAAIVFRNEYPEAAEKFRIKAGEISEYVYKRRSFHTETMESSETEPEMEDGSISCSALTLLYYCAKIEKKDEYIARAKEILDMHEAWVTYTPIAPAFHSSLRWWETFWDGNADGPSICYGHAWTIWRAEADYWYWFLTGDEKYRKKAYNGFMSNFSKIDINGKTYACYQLDYIPGGGFTGDSNEVSFKIRQGFPRQADSGHSRYVWVRAYESVLKSGLF